MDEHNGKKVERQRKRRFYNSIRQQIEFYLGDVNLSKDRFFSSLLQESPYIDVSTILNCNKIKNMTTNPKHIVKSLKNSTILAVTEDGKQVYRKIPVRPISDADECTIYVEDLPFEADHDWLKMVFKDYGEIVYVSIPRYKNSNKIKGFAFIQFASADSTSNVLQAFRAANSCLSSNLPPGKLCSVQTFEGEKETVVREHGEIDVEQIQFVDDDSAAAEEQCENECKRKIDEPVTEAEVAEEPQRKRLKEEEVEKPISEQLDKENVSEVTDQSTEPKGEGTEDENYEDKPTKKRKRKKNKKKEAVQTYGLHILSKHEWKKLRNKYLEDQRKKMHELKKQLRKSRWCPNENEVEAEKSEPVEEVETEPVSECRVKFTPGVIIKVRLDQSVKDVKHFKSEVKRYADVEYIDVNENGVEAYFRCTSNDVANQVIGLNKWPKMEILCGAEELAYWEKIKQDRKEKFDKKIRSKVRGKTKLMKKAESAFAVSHIKFPD